MTGKTNSPALAQRANRERYLVEAEAQDGRKLVLYPREPNTEERKHAPVCFSEVKEADHICWKRLMGYTHHAIVTAIDPKGSISLGCDCWRLVGDKKLR